MVKIHVTKVYETNTKKDGSELKDKRGTPFFRVGFLTQEYGEEWLSGFAYKTCKGYEGKEVEVEVTEEEYNGKKQKKFSFPKNSVSKSDFDKLAERVSKIEFHLANQARKDIDAKVPGTNEDYPEPPKEETPW
jgi:hypothetical protein